MRLIATSLVAMVLCHVALAQSVPVPVPTNNPTTPAKVSLGRMLFFDPRLSVNNTVSCSTCHDPRRGWTDGRRIAVGISNRVGIRNTPTIINAAYQTKLFWGGRAFLLEGQAFQPLTSPTEMGNPSHAFIEGKFSQIDGYKPYFKSAFGTEQVTVGAITHAIASFERTIIVGKTPISKFLAGDQGALSNEARRGFEVFKAADCASCHKPEQGFANGLFHNTGAALFDESDQGRFTVTQNQAEFRSFRTPTLFEINRTAPYMHNGRFDTIDQVIEFYDRGGDNFNNDTNKDQRVRPLGLTLQRKSDLSTFLLEAFVGEDFPFVTAPAFPQ